MKITHKITIKNGKIIPYNPEAFKYDMSQFEGKDMAITFDKWQKTRTNKQNASLWLWFTTLASELNLKGYDMRKIIRPDVEIEWTKDSLCDYLFRPLMKTMFKKKSTTKLTSGEINQIYDNLNRILVERTNGEVSVPFPNIEELFNG